MALLWHISTPTGEAPLSMRGGNLGPPAHYQPRPYWLNFVFACDAGPCDEMALSR
eukprot:CAMPEP_0170615410 /NCGR_PEP_ID=MMETSP0224-20130122/25320_1 /TAXON_ID=285029 /ORGANISM="Togula jolla, Strain CCCM 725" /LENGTH=54 /DNA_ID=CAMNT_0010941135 /DNA_START=490 /DNA_END=650 /DNA_ORIENTATION=+